MKIFRFVFSAFLTAALLVGCSKKPDEAGEGASGYSDGYLYSAHSGVLYKYNLQTGIALPLCEDPVCTHSGKSCPFYGVNTDIFEVGEFIYYIRDGEMFRYDRSTSRAEDLCKLPGTVYYPFCAFNRIYYSSFIYGMEDGELFTSADVWAYDIQSGSTQKLNTEKLYDLQKAEFVQDGWLVWYDSQTQKHYTTDADYRNRSEMDGSLFGIQSGELCYRLEVVNPGRHLFNLYRTDENGNKIVALENIANVGNTSDYLFATYNRESPKTLGKYKDSSGNVESVVEYQANEIYRFLPDGSEKTYLCTLPEEYSVYAFAFDSCMIKGDYIGIMLKDATPDEQGYLQNYSKPALNIAILNVKTGEIKITRSE